MYVGYINENKGKNWILGCLKYITIFVNMQYYFAYLYSVDHKIAVSACFGTDINKMRLRSFQARSNVRFELKLCV